MGTRLLEKILTFFFDVLALNFAFAFTFWLRFKSNIFPETLNTETIFIDYLAPSCLISGIWVLLFFFTGLYRDWYKESRLDEFFVVLRTIFFGVFTLFLMINSDELLNYIKFGTSPSIFSKTQVLTLFIYGISVLITATTNRFAMHTILAWFFSKGVWIRNVAIVGATEEGVKLLNDIEKHPHLGYAVTGFIDEDGRKKGELYNDLPIYGTYSDISTIVKKHNLSGMIISHVSTSANEIMRILKYSANEKLSIYMVPSLIDVIAGHLKTHQLFGVPLIVLLQNHMPSWQVQVKRIFDIVMSILILIIGLPLWIFVLLVVKFTSKGAAIYKQERVGQNGKPFIMMKFRSMYEDAESRTGPAWATEDDPRITPFGKFMRKSRLDEIPQLLNVLKGEMSFVGPRPERQYFIDMLQKEIPWYIRRIKMKPGITGWAQIKHKYDENIEDVKKKVMFDLYYFDNMSLLLDLKIILWTIIVVFTGKGAK